MAGFSIQPGEISKIALTIFAASYLVDKRDVLSLAGRRILGIDLPRGRDLGPVLVVWLISIGVLVRNHDLGTSLMFFGLFVVLLYAATERVSWVIIGVLLFAGGCLVSYELFGTVQERVTVWLHVFDYLHVDGYQLRVVAVRPGHRRPLRGRPGRWPSGTRPAGQVGLHPRLLRRGDRAVRRRRDAGAVPAARSRGVAAALAVRDSFGKLLVIGLSF